jgi:hypothetical protein
VHSELSNIGDDLLSHPVFSNPRTITARRDALLNLRLDTLERVAACECRVRTEMRNHPMVGALLAAAEGLDAKQLTPIAASLSHLQSWPQMSDQHTRSDVPLALGRSEETDLGADELQRELLLSAVRDVDPGVEFADLRVATERDLSVFGEAFRRLSDLAPALTASTFSFATSVIVVSKVGVRSFSTSKIPRVIFVGDNELESPADLAESLLHEALHLKLFAISETSPLYDRVAEVTSRGYEIPWRSYTAEYPWNIDRVAAAAHLYCHLMVLNRHPLAGHALPSGPIAETRARRLVELMSSSGVLTNDGRSFVSWMAGLFDDWPSSTEHAASFSEDVALPDSGDIIAVPMKFYRAADLALSVVALRDRNEVKVVSPFALLVLRECSTAISVERLVDHFRSLAQNEGKVAGVVVVNTIRNLINAGVLTQLRAA